jgi:hypothetical protein
MANGQVRPSYCRTITTFRFTGWGTVPYKKRITVP